MSRPKQKPFRKMRLVPIYEDEGATTASKEEIRERLHEEVFITRLEVAVG